MCVDSKKLVLHQTALKTLESYGCEHCTGEALTKISWQQRTASEWEVWSWLVSDCISLVACDNCCVSDCRCRASTFRPVSSSREAICIWIPTTTYCTHRR